MNKENCALKLVDEIILYGRRNIKRKLYMSLKEKRLRLRPRNRWQDGVREDGRLVGGRKGYIRDKNGRSSSEWQGIVAFCTCQWND